MMPPLKTPQANRRLALGLLGLLVLALVALIAMPAWLANVQYDGEIARLNRQHVAYQRLNAARPDLQAGIDTLKKRDLRRLYVKGTSAALASAEVLDAVKGIIEGAGARVLSSQALPAKDEAGHRWAGASLSLSGSIQSLRKVLHAVEAREPWLFIDGLKVNAQVPPNYKPVAGVEPDLFIQIDVSAYAVPVVATGANGAASDAKAKP